MIFEKKRVRHHHEQDHNSDHFHESNHSHGDSIESKDEKTLKILLVHWVNHNESHEEGFREWVDKARNIGKDDFNHDEVFLVDTLKEHMAYRLWQQRQNRIQFGEKLTVSAATEKFGLTRQEHNILHLLMEGKDNSFICDYLSISINTLKKHILNIYRKLGIRNRVQLFKKIREKE